MTEMVERVARAICDAIAAAPEYLVGRFPYESAATAAIEAMREPRAAMVRAATATVPTWDDAASVRKWEAMISAALATDPTTPTNQ